MNYEEAKYQLQLHVGVIDEARKAMILSDGFLTSLRPYSGLQEKNFHLVMEALLTVGERIHRSPEIDRELVRTIWLMCSWGRLWGLHPDGMLQRNQLITSADTSRLEFWIDTIDQTALSLLCGTPPHFAAYHYAEYVVRVGWWDNIEFFISLMDIAVSDPNVGTAITMILQALGKLGGLAKTALPTLREALLRTYSWSHPELTTPLIEEGCTKLVRESIRKTIHSIEHDSAEF